jgi:hypothetical protein
MRNQVASVKTCAACGRSLPVNAFGRQGKGRRAWCKDCSNRYSRAYRRRNESVRARDRARQKLPHRQALARKLAKRWRIDNPEAARAHDRLNSAVRYGKLKRFPCEICGRRKVHAHHRDYSKPLDVRWLCPRHHYQAHGLNPRDRRPAK